LFQKIKGQFLLLWNAIAKTYAENSLKLIALKDLLESYLKKQKWMNYCCNFFENVVNEK
jgi:hypothetical protein